MGNPLVAPTTSSTTAVTGVPILEDAGDVKNSIESGDWASGVLGAANVAMDALDFVEDPFGSILAAGVGWLMEHVGPLKHALDALAGNSDAITAHAQTWQNISQELSQISSDLTNYVTSDLSSWSGPSADTYRQQAGTMTDLLNAASQATAGTASGVSTAGTVVASVRGLVRDTIAQVVAHMVSWALQVIATLGIGLAWVVPQVIQLAAKTAAHLADLTKKLISAIKTLTGLMNKAGKTFDDASSALNKIQKGTPGTSSVPTSLPGVKSFAPKSHGPSTSGHTGGGSTVPSGSSGTVSSAIGHGTGSVPSTSTSGSTVASGASGGPGGSVSSVLGGSGGPTTPSGAGSSRGLPPEEIDGKPIPTPPYQPPPGLSGPLPNSSNLVQPAAAVPGKLPPKPPGAPWHWSDPPPPGHVPLTDNTIAHTVFGDTKPPKPGKKPGKKPPAFSGGHVPATSMPGATPPPGNHGTGVVANPSPKPTNSNPTGQPMSQFNPPPPNSNLVGGNDPANPSAPPGIYNMHQPQTIGADGNTYTKPGMSTVFPDGMHPGIVQNVGSQGWNWGSPNGGVTPHTPPVDTSGNPQVDKFGNPIPARPGGTWTGQGQVPFTPVWNPGNEPAMPPHGAADSNNPWAGQVVNVDGYYDGNSQAPTFWPNATSQQPPRTHP